MHTQAGLTAQSVPPLKDTFQLASRPKVSMCGLLLTGSLITSRVFRSSPGTLNTFKLKAVSDRVDIHILARTMFAPPHSWSVC